MAFESGSVKRLRRNWLALGWRLGLLLVPTGIAWLAVRLGEDSGGAALLAVLSGMFAVLGAVLTLDGLLANPSPVAVPGQLRAGRDGVTWNGRMLLQRSQIAAGFFIPTTLLPYAAPGLVRLERRFPRKHLTFEVSDEPTGRALLEALELDASQTTANLRFAPLVRTHPQAGGATLLAAFGIFPGALIALGLSAHLQSMVPGIVGAVAFVAGLVWGALYNLVPTRVRIGADGLLVSWLWMRRFVRCQDITELRIVPSTGGIAIRVGLRGGDTLELPMRRPHTAEQGREDAALAMRRIQHAAALHDEARDAGAALPERAGRTAFEWVRSLRAAGSGANADHRTAPVAPDRLLRIVEDPGADPLARGTAAVALGRVLDPDGRARLRVAAAATAAPEVRGLLELAAEEEASEEALGAALERLTAR